MLDMVIIPTIRPIKRRLPSNFHLRMGKYRITLSLTKVLVRL